MRPHAVTQVAGTLNATYSYDANGNMTAGAGRTVTWTSFNMPSSITRGSNVLTFSYDPEHNRTRQVAPDGTTTYLHDPGSGLRVERFNAVSGASRWNNYLYAAGGMVGVVYEHSALPTQTRYFHNDHLGSISVITDG